MTSIAITVRDIRNRAITALTRKNKARRWRALRSLDERTALLLLALGRRLEPLARLFGFLLKLFLQFLLIFLELLRVGRRPFVRLGEVGQRQHVGRRLARQVD